MNVSKRLVDYLAGAEYITDLRASFAELRN